MSEMDYAAREGAKERERLRQVPWENYKKSKEWADTKKKILQKEREDRGSTPVRTKTPSVTKD
tara:strand:+ start:4786 stop:4974 length:189 start_codon:yes stop_codon:yes gene_type:complete